VRIRHRCLVISSIAILFVCLFLSTDSWADQQKVLKIGFVLVGAANDAGYNYEHNQGRLFLQSHLPNVETSVVESVPESAEAGRVMEKMIAQGNRLIFSTSYGFLEPAERVAKNHPDTIFMQTWRPSKLKNMGCYAAYQFEPLYAVGIVAGKMTKKNSIGFVCAHPVPILLQNINAFTLGAKSVNPKAKVKVVWTNSWNDPATESEAVKGLIDSGVDVVGSVLDSNLTVAKVANQAKVMMVGTQADLRDTVPATWLAGSHWNWDQIYLKVAKQVQNGTWKPETYWLGMRDGAVDISSFGARVPKEVQEQSKQTADQIRQGKKIIFRGPMKDRDGKVRIADGQIADAKMLSEMDWVVEGVETTLPKH